MKRSDKRRNNGGHKTAGRKTREANGLLSLVRVEAKILQTEADICRERHKSIAGALRFASGILSLKN